MKRFFILYCFAALVLSSCGGDAVVINEGTLYRIITDKDEGFGRFTRTSGSYWRGTYYRETEGALNASARDVVFRNGRRPSMESADGEKFRVESITEYEPPRCKEYPFATDYRDSVFSVTELHDITYAKAYGYWSSFPDNGRSNLAIFMSRVPDLSKSGLDLTMDIYLPEDGGKVLRPLLILIHGGAFFNGDKASRIENQVGLLEEALAAHRHQFRIARAGADDLDVTFADRRGFLRHGKGKVGTFL